MQDYSAGDVREMAESGICEPSRLLHICGMMEAGRPLYNSDRAYLDRVASRLADKEAALRRENRRIRRVLGAGPRAKGEAAPPPPPPVPAIVAGAARSSPAPGSVRGRQPAPPQPGSGSSASDAPRRRPLLGKGAPALDLSASAPAAPLPARGAGDRRTLIDDASFDAILERRDRRRRSEARERAAEAAVSSSPAAPSPAPARPPCSGDGAAKAAAQPPTIAGRLREIVAGRR